MTIRTMLNHAGRLYYCQGDKLYSLDSQGHRAELGTLFSIAGKMDSDSTLSQACFNDGSYLYTWNPVTQAFAVAAGYTGGARISFLDQRINGIKRGTQTFQWSALTNALNWETLDFASAETSPDKLVSQTVKDRELYLMGEVGTEIWDPSTAADPDIPYVRSSGVLPYGCAAAHTVQKTPKSVIWLARDQDGGYTVVASRGHQVAPISNRALEERLANRDLSQAYAISYTEGGQMLYCLNVPGLDTTWVWDDKWEQWHERCEYRNGVKSQWRPTAHAFVYNRHYFGDADDRIYTSDRNCHRYGEDVILRERTAPVISKSDRDNAFYPALEIICEKGTGAELRMQYSDDGGKNYSDWESAEVGEVGVFNRRAVWNRLGSAVDRVFRVRCTADAPFNPVGVSMEPQ